MKQKKNNPHLLNLISVVECFIFDNTSGKLEELMDHECYVEGDAKGDVPTTLLEPKLINGLTFGGTFKALLDSGASVTCIHRRVLPVDCLTRIVDGCSVQGFGGTQLINEAVDLEDVILPEFGRSLRIEKIRALVFVADTQYDIIIGRDVLQPAGFTLDFGENLVRWMGMQVSMRRNLVNEQEVKFIEREIDYIASDHSYLSTQKIKI